MHRGSRNSWGHTIFIRFWWNRAIWNCDELDFWWGLFSQGTLGYSEINGFEYSDDFLQKCFERVHFPSKLEGTVDGWLAEDNKRCVTGNYLIFTSILGQSPISGHKVICNDSSFQIKTDLKVLVLEYFKVYLTHFSFSKSSNIF